MSLVSCMSPVLCVSPVLCMNPVSCMSPVLCINPVLCMSPVSCMSPVLCISPVLCMSPVSCMSPVLCISPVSYMSPVLCMSPVLSMIPVLCMSPVSPWLWKLVGMETCDASTVGFQIEEAAYQIISFFPTHLLLLSPSFPPPLRCIFTYPLYIPVSIKVSIIEVRSIWSVYCRYASSPNQILFIFISPCFSIRARQNKF
jgi:hypothetical protein